MITPLRLYYIKLTSEQKKDFKERVIKRVQISPSSFYRFLDNIPNVLVKEVIADITTLPIKDLYTII